MFSEFASEKTFECTVLHEYVSASKICMENLVGKFLHSELPDFLDSVHYLGSVIEVSPF